MFKYGVYGVHLFFVVSGFVIALTLYRCSSPVEFAVRRLARLWPSMALCSATTLLLIHVIPNHTFHVSPAGLIPSLTFIDPDLLNRLFRTKVFDWIDGAYWSLFVEVRFYCLAAFLFFYRRNRFPESAYLFGRIILAVSLLAAFLRLERLHSALNLFFVADYLPWFLIGIAFFLRENRIEERLRTGLFLVGFLSLLAKAALDRSYSAVGIAFLVPLIFLAASRISVANRILSHQWITGVGAASYSLYLLHQNLGTALIGWLGETLQFRGYPSVLLAVLTALLAAISARAIYTYWETPLNRFIVSRLKVKRPIARFGQPGRIDIMEEKAGPIAA
jgi:peptidoglycan/LPS O-acetylase OafA/YrhL